MLHRERIQIFTAKEALVNLSLLSEQLKSLKEKEPNYTTIIDYICVMPSPAPTLKSISRDTGLKTHVLEKQIKDLYYLVLEKENFLKFDKVEYNLIYKIEQLYYNLTLDKLAAIPNVGETFESYFLQGIMGTGTFTVKRIMHSLEEDKQVVNIFLGEYCPQKESST